MASPPFLVPLFSYISLVKTYCPFVQVELVEMVLDLHSTVEEKTERSGLASLELRLRSG